MPRDVFRETVGWFADIVSAASADRWDSPALGVWSVRDLVGHASRGLHHLPGLTDPPAEKREIEGTSDFYAHLFDPSATIGNPADVARMGKEFGQTLGDDPASTVRGIVDAAMAFVGRQPDDVLLRSPIGGVRLIDYLPTRVLEVTVHTMDLAKALGITVEPPAECLRETLYGLSDFAVRRGVAGEVAFTLTGRQTLSQGFNVVA